MLDPFGSAAPLYKKLIHPRVLVDAAGLTRIKRLCKSGEGKKIHDALRAKAWVLTERIENTADLPQTLSIWNDRWDLPGTAIIWGLHDVAFIGVLDEDARFIEAAKRALLALVDADKIKGRDKKHLGHGMEPYVPLAYDMLHAYLTPEQRLTMVNWFVEFGVRFALKEVRGRYMRCAGQNIAMGEVLTGLVTLLMVEGDPGAPDLSRERQRFITYLEATINSAIGPAGYPWEDIGYGSGMGGWIAYAVEAAYRAGAFDAYIHCPHYQRFGDAMLHFVQPWGNNLSNTGDHGDDFGQRSLVLARLAAHTKNPAVEWLRREIYYPSAVSGPRKTDSAAWGETPLTADTQLPTCASTLIALGQTIKPRHPKLCKTPTQYVDKGRGIVTLRSDWSPDATFVVFDGSQRSAAASGHDHASAGHFSLSALGEYFAIDTGRYNIEQNQHNVVLVNGKSGRSTHGEWRFAFEAGTLLGETFGPFVDTASADASHQSNCIWSRRTVGLVKGARPYAWTVDDVNFDHGASGIAEYWWAMNTHPDNKIEIKKQSATVRGHKYGNLLDIHFALPAADAFSIPHRLSFDQNLQLSGSENYIPDPLVRARQYREMVGDLVHGPVYARPRLVAKIAGFNGRFMSVMLPRKKGEPAAVVKRIPTEDNVLGVTIRWNDIEDTLLWAYEHQMLDGGDVSARGQWCVVRRAVRNGKVLDYALGEGTRLKVAGKALIGPG